MQVRSNLDYAQTYHYRLVVFFVKSVQHKARQFYYLVRSTPIREPFDGRINHRSIHIAIN